MTTQATSQSRFVSTVPTNATRPPRLCAVLFSLVILLIPGCSEEMPSSLLFDCNIPPVIGMCHYQNADGYWEPFSPEDTETIVNMCGLQGRGRITFDEYGQANGIECFPPPSGPIEA